jgi:hypothetical protein
MERAADRGAGPGDTAVKRKGSFAGGSGRRGKLPIAEYCCDLGCGSPRRIVWCRRG